MKWRLVGLGAAVAVLGTLIVVVTLNSQRRSRELHARLVQVDLESFGIADHFTYALREVNDRLRHYASFRGPEDWESFVQASHNLELWMEQQSPRTSTQQEKEVLQRMDAAYRAYAHGARDLHDLMESSGKTGASLADFDAVFAQSRRLRDLGEELARAHYASREELLGHTTRVLSELRLSVLGLVALLFLLGLAFAWLVYREMIAPLRIKLVESQALAERNEKLASLGLLAAGVAHEIRTPLTAIKGALYIQQKRFAPGAPEKADAALIEREVGRLERIATSFLQFARPAEPELKKVPASRPLEEVQELLSAAMAKAHIQLLMEKSPPLQIAVDLAQFRQVLINLVHNAAESMEGGGTITLRARPDRKRLAGGEADVVILEVIDTGSGIRPDIEKRLFDPFFTTKANGTGLGLVIAGRIVEKHGGALQYQTQLDHGTTFGVILPQVP